LVPEKTTFIPDTFLLRNSHQPLVFLHAWCLDENIGLEIFYAGAGLFPAMRNIPGDP